jgi:radical SAM superfamily enzyme YgiQ (UPF0313 family)
MLERSGHSSKILDLNVESLFPPAELASADVFMITAMTTTFSEALKHLDALKLWSGRRVIGGVHPTIFPHGIDADYVVQGPGEWFVEQLNHLSSLPKLVQSHDFDMDDLPFPAYHLLQMDRYHPHPPHGKYQPWLPMITSRGCPYRCSYCSKAVFGNKYRHMSPERIIEEIKWYIYKYKVKEICFYDDVFTVNSNHVTDLVKLLAPLKIHWTCETRTNLVDRTLLGMMKDAGCYSISYGLESGSRSVLNNIDKMVTVEQNTEALHLTHDVGIETVGYFMVGSPGETCQDIEQTVRWAQKQPLDYAQFAITTPLPGSRLYEEWFMRYPGRQIGWDDFAYDGSSKSPVFDDILSRDEIEYYRKWAYRQFYLRLQYIWYKLLQLRSISDIKMAFAGLRMLSER